MRRLCVAIAVPSVALIGHISSVKGRIRGVRCNSYVVGV